MWMSIVVVDQQHQQQRNEQQLHEARHMNVGWVRHNAPREPLDNYQHGKYAASCISITAQENEKEAKKKAADCTRFTTTCLQHSFSSNCVLQRMIVVDTCFYILFFFFVFCFCCVLFSSVVTSIWKRVVLNWIQYYALSILSNMSM